MLWATIMVSLPGTMADGLRGLPSTLSPRIGRQP